MRSKLYRLNLSMSGEALCCTDGSQYGEVHTVQVELVHVWRGVILYKGALYNEVHAVQAELVHAWRGPCTVQRSPVL